MSVNIRHLYLVKFCFKNTTTLALLKFSNDYLLIILSIVFSGNCIGQVRLNAPYEVTLDSTIYYTVIGNDTIKMHYDTLKPIQFTYLKTYYYSSQIMRSFKVLTGQYSNFEKAGVWQWSVHPSGNLDINECVQLGVYVEVIFDSTAIKFSDFFSQDSIVLNKISKKLTETIHPPNFKASRFEVYEGVVQFLDLNTSEVYYGHLEYLDALLVRHQITTSIKLVTKPLELKRG